MTDLTIYTKPHCQPCAATKRMAARVGLAYEEIDVSADAGALEFIVGLGYQEAPVVVAGEQSWSGYRPDLIKALAASKEEQTA